MNCKIGENTSRNDVQIICYKYFFSDTPYEENCPFPCLIKIKLFSFLYLGDEITRFLNGAR